ncbi:MAG: NUDIX domain-containing protein [Phycisphaerales bacterium]
MSSFELISRAILLDRGHVLLCRNLKRGYYYLPGGHVEFSESAAAAAVRELVEETGLRIRIRRCVLVEEHSFTQRGKKKSRRRHELNVLFTARFSRARRPLQPVRSRENHIAFDWVPLTRLRSVRLRPAHHAASIRRAARGDSATVFDSRTGEP